VGRTPRNSPASSEHPASLASIEEAIAEYRAGRMVTMALTDHRGELLKRVRETAAKCQVADHVARRQIDFHELT